MNTEALPSCVAIVTVAEARRAKMLETTVLGLCAHANRIAEEREQLRSSIERALHDLRNGWSAAALDVLARAIGEST